MPRMPAPLSLKLNVRSLSFDARHGSLLDSCVRKAEVDDNITQVLQ